MSALNRCMKGCIQGISYSQAHTCNFILIYSMHDFTNTEYVRGSQMISLFSCFKNSVSSLSNRCFVILKLIYLFSLSRAKASKLLLILLMPISHFSTLTLDSYFSSIYWCYSFFVLITSKFKSLIF